jgi:hypothetical protein
MRFFRRVAAVVAFVLGGVLLLIGGLTTSEEPIKRTIAHNRQIEASFQLTAGFVTAFQKTHQRLPTRTELDDWADRYPDRPYTPRGMFLSEAPNNPGGFVLSYWRGERHEHYASWSGRSTLEFDPKKYYKLGSPLLDALAFLGAGLAALIFGFFTWPRR